jgi:hypothetical protein
MGWESGKLEGARMGQTGKGLRRGCKSQGRFGTRHRANTSKYTRSPH